MKLLIYTVLLFLIFGTPSMAAAENQSTNATLQPLVVSKTQGKKLSTPTFKSEYRPKTKQLWNLQNADIRGVISAISKETGKNFMVDPKVSGKISITSSHPIDSDEAYQVFLSALELLGFAAVQDGEVIRIIPNNLMRQSAPISTKIDPKGQGSEMVVQVINLQNVSASQIAPILQPLLPNYGQVTAYAPANTLILSGTVRNIDRMRKIIRELDQSSQNDIDLIHLRYTSADKTVALIKSLQQADQKLGKIIRASLVADEQHNNILMTGSQDARLKMRVLISELDTPTSGGNATRTFSLNHLKAKEFAPILNKIAQSAYLNMFAASGSAASAKQKINIEAEEKTNTVIISAPASMMRTLQDIMRKLDMPSRQVLVEAIIAEVDESTAKKIGTTWTTSDFEAGLNNEAKLGFKVTSGILNGTQFNAAVAAFLNNGTGDILSRPSTVVLDNQKAAISVGQNISIKNQSYNQANSGEGQPFDTFSRRDVDLKLEVTPQISPNNSIQLTIDLTNDSLPPGTANDQPQISTSKITTAVRVKSGDIVALGGLMRHNITDSTDKFPILGDIPIVNLLFRKQNKTVSKKELMVFIRPIVLGEHNSKRIVTEQYNRVRDAQLLHHYKKSLIKKNEVPLLPPFKKTRTKLLPKPF